MPNIWFKTNIWFNEVRQVYCRAQVTATHSVLLYKVSKQM